MADNPKKRSRRVFSCSNCRQKKRRCDRSFPCGECSRQGLSDSCRFEDVKPFPNSSVLPPASLTSNSPTHLFLSQEIKNEIRNGDNAQITKEDAIATKDYDFNFFQALNKLKDGRIEASLLGFNTMAGADPFTAIMKHLMANQLIWDNVISKDGMVPEDKFDRLEQKAISHFGAAFVSKLTARSSDDDFNAARQALNAGNFRYGICYKPFDSWTRLPLIEQVGEMLPPHSVLIGLIQVFFNFQKKWLPILDETKFFKDLNRVIGPTEDGQCVIKRFENRTDAAVLASLLLALRLAYTIVVHSPSECNEYERTLLIKSPIPIDAVEVAKEIIKELSICDGPSLHNLRTLLILQTIYIFCPENDSSNDSSSCKELMHRIVSQAVLLNLNLDYSMLASWRQNLKLTEKALEEARVLWYAIVRLDILCSVLHEVEPCTRPFSYIVDPPSDKETSKWTEIFYLTKSTYEELQALIISLVPFANTLKYSELVSKIQKFENRFTGDLGKLEDYLCPLGELNSLMKCQKFILLIICKGWLLTVYNSLSLFFEREKELELSFEYVKKHLNIAIRDFSFLEAGLLDHMDEYFGSGAFLLLVPFVMKAVKAQLGASAFGIRCSLASRLSQGSQMDMEGIRAQHLYETIGQGVMSIIEIALEFLEPLSEAFQQAWGLCRSTRFGKLIVLEKGPVAAADFKGQGVTFNLTVGQLKEINDILNDASLERKLYKIMYGSGKRDQDPNTESVESRMLAAFQLERKWQLMKAIHSRSQKNTFLNHVGIRNEDLENTTPVSMDGMPYNMDYVQGFDPQLIMDFLYSGDI